jgi:UPF0716 family protein affecting phage T7 exclusion
MALFGTGTTIILVFAAVVFGIIFFKIKGNVSLGDIFRK